MSTLRVCAGDLSLTSSGIAGPDGLERVRTKPEMPLMERIRIIRDRFLAHAANADVVAVEQLAFTSKTGKAAERAGMWFVVVEAVDARGIPWVAVEPARVKLYATGKGSGVEKDEVLAAAIKRYGHLYDITGNDIGDAVVIKTMTEDAFGCAPVRVPVKNRTAITGGKNPIVWPTVHGWSRAA